MRTISKIIPDLGNVLSGLRSVFDKISEQSVVAASKKEFEDKIQPEEDCLHFNDQQSVIAFETQFLEELIT